MLVATLAIALCLVRQDDAEEEAVDPAAVAFDNFRALDPAEQEAIVAAVEAKVEQSQEADLKKLLQLRDRARRELPKKPAEPLAYFEHSVYAPIQIERHYVAKDGDEAAQQYDLMRGWENAPPFAVTRVLYDFAADCGRETMQPAPPVDRLTDLYYGFVPDNDVLVAWMEWRLDVKDDLNKIADHFAHAYCDRVGVCYPNLTIYDAMASNNAMEMSDIDVIAYARNVAKDNSFESPIPANRKQQELYERIGADFLRYFKHRTAVELAAWVFVNPDVAVREQHQGFQEYFWTLYAKKSTFDAAASDWKGFKDRESFTAKMDDWRKTDDALPQKASDWRAARNATRWVINGLAVAALKERGLWPAEGAAPAKKSEEKKTEGDGAADSSGESKPAASGGSEEARNSGEEAKTMKVGDKAPDFAVSDEGGKIRTLTEFRGKTVVLWFYPKANTPG